jgi:hypothetical protein
MTNRSILRRLSKFSLFTFVALVAVLLLVAAALSARLAAGPLSIAFLGPRLQEELGERVYMPMTLSLMTLNFVATMVMAIWDWQWSACVLPITASRILPQCRKLSLASTSAMLSTAI